MKFVITYFVKTKTRESKKEKNAFNKWYGKSLIIENPKKNLQALIIKAPIKPKIRANIWWLNKSIFNIK